MRDHGSNGQGDSDTRYGMTYRSMLKLPTMTGANVPCCSTALSKAAGNRLCGSPVAGPLRHDDGRA
jgi:hypothetical protein